MDEMDYRKLCVELFGTDDVERLQVLANSIKQRNGRNAGRKKVFNAEDISQMQILRCAGTSIEVIAKQFGTSRQTISRYLNSPLVGNFTMRITYMYRKFPCTIIDVDFINQQIQIQNITNDILHRAFGVNESPTWEDFEQFLQDRCIPPSRGMLKDALEDLGVDSYDPLRIVEKTKGRVSEDGLWMKFHYRCRKGIKNDIH